MDTQTTQSYRSFSKNNYQKFDLHDYEGLLWTAQLETTPEKTNGENCWITTVTLKCTANATQLADSKTLDPKDDERLLSLIGSKLIHFQSTPKTFKARTEEQVLRLAFASRHDFLKELRDPAHLSRKKSVIASWVDRWLQFG